MAHHNFWQGNDPYDFALTKSLWRWVFGSSLFFLDQSIVEIPFASLPKLKLFYSMRGRRGRGLQLWPHPWWWQLDATPGFQAKAPTPVTLIISMTCAIPWWSISRVISHCASMREKKSNLAGSCGVRSSIWEKSFKSLGFLFFFFHFSLQMSSLPLKAT